METLYIPVTLLAVLAIIIWVRLRVRAGFRRQPIRVRPRPLLDEARVGVFRTLTRALPEYLVFPAVSYSGFLLPHSGKGGGRGKPADADILATLHAYNADFLICRPDTSVVAVVRLQLDGGIDTEAEALLREAAIPLLRYDPTQPMDESELHETVRDLETLSAVDVDEAGGEAGGERPRRRAARRGSPERRQEPKL